MRWCAILLPAMLYAAVAAAEVPVPSPPRGDGAQCVEPTEVMRRDHMKFLMHQRDETMHRGIRTTKHSLVECLSCHTRKDDEGRFVSINAPGEFCQECHAYSGVTMDCFGCHATTPRQPTSRSAQSLGRLLSDTSFRLHIQP